MITLGIDLAGQPAGTAACAIEWQPGTAIVRSVACGLTDADLLGAIGTASRVGIDVPLGWPESFVAFVAAHHHAGRLPETPLSDLRYRDTDRFVRGLTGRWPLSVSSDLIAVPAFRAARLLSALAARGEAVDRSGSGKMVEAYPAAALKRWGFDAVGYKKKKGRERRAALFQALESRASAWLKLDPAMRSACCDRDDALDALVAAVIARAATVGLCEPIPPESRARAAIEGWIALPTPASFDRLA